MTIGRDTVRAHVVAAGVKVGSCSLDNYSTSTTKNAKDFDRYPW